MTEAQIIKQMKSLHREAFPTDSDAYIRQFYASLDARDRIVVTEEGRVVSMGSIVEKRCRLWGETERFPYISAVATTEDCRGRGLAGEVMAEALRRLYTRGALFAALKPFSDTYYLRYGFCDVSKASKDTIAGGVDAEVRPCGPDDFDTVERLEAAMRRGCDNYLLFGREEWEKKRAEFAADEISCNLYYRGGRAFAYAFCSDFIEHYATDDMEAFRRCEPLKGRSYYDFSGAAPYVQARVVDARRALLRLPAKDLGDFTCRLRIKDDIIMDNNIEGVYAVTNGRASLTLPGEDKERGLIERSGADVTENRVRGRKEKDGADVEAPARLNYNRAENLPEYVLTAAELTGLLLTGGAWNPRKQKNYFPDRY